VLLYSFRESIGRSLISLGQQLSAPSETSQAQVPDTPKPTAEGVQQPTPANSGTQPASANPDKENNAASTSPSQPATTSSDKSEPARPPSDREKAVSPPAKQQSQFRDERPASPAEEAAPKNTRNQDPAEEVRALWSAVSQGDTSAEVTLAKLYMIGRGVKKNCDQARVLLRVAAKKGNPEAIAKLSQITRQGCP
jgi:TPR repeat protein